MPRLIKLWLLVVLLSVGAYAQSPITGWCEQGGQTVTTAGAVSSTKVQKSYVGCTITVYNAGTTTPSTIFSDSIGTPKANPFTAGSNGYYNFYANNGSYDVQVSNAGLAAPVIIDTRKITDAATSGGINSLNGLTGTTQTFSTANDTNITLGVSSVGTTHSFTPGWTGQLAVGRGGLGVGTLASNGVLFGNGTSAVQVTAQGAANSVLTANAGSPLFSSTPTLDRTVVNPAAFSYDLNVGSLAVAFMVGTGPQSPPTINVPSAKVLSGFQFNATNSGAGKLLGLDIQLTASGATQDIEPIRAIVGRVSNSGTVSPQKTTFIRGGASGIGANTSQLVGSDMDITVVAGTDASSKVYGCTVFGPTNDVSSGMLIESADGARLLLGIGSIVNPVPITAAFYRAWMATASAANARAFQILNNAAAEVGFISKTGTFQSGLAGTSIGGYSLSGNTSGTISILPQAAAGTYNLNLPTSAGSAGQPLLSGGGGAAAMTFGTLGVTGGGTGLATATQGDLLFGSAANTYSALAKDTNTTRYLSNTGTSNNPAWAQVNLANGVTGSLPQTAVSNLGLVFISTVNITSSTATADFTGLDSTYDVYVLVINNAVPVTDDTEAWLRIGTGGTPTYQTANYQWAGTVSIAATATGIGSTSDAKIAMTKTGAATEAVGNAAGESFSATITINNPASTTDFLHCAFDATYNRAVDGAMVSNPGSGEYHVAGAITALRFMFSSGNITRCRATLYGYRKS